MSRLCELHSRRGCGQRLERFRRRSCILNRLWHEGDGEQRLAAAVMSDGVVIVGVLFVGVLFVGCRYNIGPGFGRDYEA